MELEPALLINAIRTARENGFNVVGFSGGEPLMYSGLPQVLDAVRECGMVATVTSNGMLLNAKNVDRLKGRANLVAISIDGKPASHNKIRHHPKAFSKMKENLENLRNAEIPFGFIFTLTQHNLHELEWIAEFALEQGAKLLQVHPLEDIGRAKDEMKQQAPDALEAAYAFVEVARLQAMAGDAITFQIDVIDRNYLMENPERVFAEDIADSLDDIPFADIVSPLILEDDGRVNPIAYGFGRNWSFGNLHQQSLQKMMDDWRREKAVYFREMCKKVLESVAKEESEWPFFNWYSALEAEAEKAPAIYALSRSVAVN
jgi:Fe-coproporphyrin III synthase